MKSLIAAAALLASVSSVVMAADGAKIPAGDLSYTADTPTAHNTPGDNNIPGGMIGPNESEATTGQNTLGANDLVGGIAKNEPATPGTPWGLKPSDSEAQRPSIPANPTPGS